MAMMVKEIHKEHLCRFKEYQNIEKTLQQKLIEGVDEICLDVLRNLNTDFLNLPI